MALRRSCRLQGQNPFVPVNSNNNNNNTTADTTRRSRRILGLLPTRDGQDDKCFICQDEITITMRRARTTPCCMKRIHFACYQTHRRASRTCGNCRREWTTVQNPRAPFPPAPSRIYLPEIPRVAEGERREQQRLQAIQDLEALLAPGALEHRITQVSADH